MTGSDSVLSIKGVGPEVAKKLRILGITTISELLLHYPRRYEDYSNVSPIQNIKPGQVTIKAVIKQIKGRYVRRGMHITEAVASDDTSSVRVIWFNQPYRENAMRPGQEYFISGELGLSHQRMSITNPAVELVSDFPVSTARIVPVYRETKGLKSAQIRKYIKACSRLINGQAETLPSWILASHALMSRSDAMFSMHFPESLPSLEMAKKRLGFEEVFELSLAALLNKYELLQEESVVIPFDVKIAQDFVKHLPFTLTDAQKQVIWQIYNDLAKSQPMNRLVEGDVGSGKTVVAAMSAVMAMQQGFQVAYMAPTALLARQHADTLKKLLTPLDFDSKVGELRGSMKTPEKKIVYDKLENGELGLIVGTHAVIQDKVRMKRLGLVIIDEQHRFGVEQRKRLQAKAGIMPHVLTMTATPIPRTLALTLYGELDISVINTKPAGRLLIKTELVSPNSKQQMYDKVDKELEAGRQMFVVCPLITDEDPSKRSVEAVHTELSRKYFKNRHVGLLHGKLSSAEKDQIMADFIEKKYDILVSTTVIEVGVDVPNATVMIIEDAERFGLAQLHQLRGRVGRSEHQGYCYLILSDSKPASRRLRALEQSHDGFKLAELDLELRGPGAIYGTMQHGELDLRVAKLTDVKLISQARSAAQQFIDNKENLIQYNHLYNKVQKLRAVTNVS